MTKPKDQRHSPPPPPRLDQALFRDARRFNDIDTAVWLYLCELIPDAGGTFRDRAARMMASISPELQRYYLTRLFDWERGSGGLEGCMMREEDDLFLLDTIAAYEFLGAKEHAQIIRELIPIARARALAIDAADKAGREFEFDDDPFEAFESRWDKACQKFDFYRVIFRDMKKRPEKYTHPNDQKGHFEREPKS